MIFDLYAWHAVHLDLWLKFEGQGHRSVRIRIRVRVRMHDTRCRLLCAKVVGATSSEGFSDFELTF